MHTRCLACQQRRPGWEVNDRALLAGNAVALERGRARDRLWVCSFGDVPLAMLSLRKACAMGGTVLLASVGAGAGSASASSVQCQPVQPKLSTNGQKHDVSNL